MNYRKIYKKHFGEIPKDEHGRSFEIHHIDGNRSNNDISNLKCVSLKEHYEIHCSQGDWGACLKIGRKLNISPKEMSDIVSRSNKKRIENGTHPFLDKEQQRIRSIESNRKRLENKTHHLLDGSKAREFQKARFESGTHHFQKVTKVICPFCFKEGQSFAMKRWHFDNCKMKGGK
jgi:hypothetical protein